MGAVAAVLLVLVFLATLLGSGSGLHRDAAPGATGALAAVRLLTLARDPGLYLEVSGGAAIAALGPTPVDHVARSDDEASGDSPEKKRAAS